MIYSDYVTLEVEVPTTGKPNLVQNPDGRLGTWGWETPVVNTTLAPATGSTPSLLFTTNVSQVAYFRSEFMEIPANQYTGIRFDLAGITASHNVRTQVEYYNASKVLISAGSSSAQFSTPQTIYVNGTTQAPAGTAYVKLRFNLHSGTGISNPSANAWVRVTNIMLTYESRTFSAPWTFVGPRAYQSIIGDASNISINRKELDAGLLNVTLHGAALDPAEANSIITPGKRVRVRVQGMSLIEGIISNASATYNPAEGGTTIVIAASDNGTILANTPENRVVPRIEDLPYLLEGKGVPWSINGSGAQPAGTPNVVALNESASLMDQVAIARDTELAYAWVDTNGVLQVSNQPYGSSAFQFSLTPDYYSDIDATFNTDECINSVVVKILRYNIGTGETTEGVHGPYNDEESIKKYGARSKEFTVANLAGNDEATLAGGIASEVLAKNAVPVRKVNSVTWHVTKPADFVDAQYWDIYNRTAVLLQGLFNYTVFTITGIEHTITPNDWIVKATFADTDSVATPTKAPPITNSGISIGTGDAGEIFMYPGVSREGALLCDGAGFSSITYPKLAQVVGDKFAPHSGTTYYLPNFTNRFPMGGTPGATGGSDTVTLNPLQYKHTHPVTSTVVNTTTVGGSNARVTNVNNNTGGADAGAANTSVPIKNPYLAINFFIKY